ncbi:MAG TPA: hypothetical protein VMF68_07205 [Spirochaetia bacterium]|nr:hypothetical protein [Spirochaetia bacterium]
MDAEQQDSLATPSDGYDGRPLGDEVFCMDALERGAAPEAEALVHHFNVTSGRAAVKDRLPM